MKEKRKLVYIITRLDGGGAQKSVLHSALYFEKYYEVHLIFGRGGMLDAYAKKNINHFYSLKTLRHDVAIKNLFWDVLAMLQIALLIRKINPDIVHTNCPKAGILGRWAALFSLRRSKKVHTYHGMGFSMYDGKIKYNLFAFIERITSWITDKLLFVSMANMGAAHGRGIGNHQKNILLRAGIGAPRLSKKPKLPFVPGMKKVVLGIGNFKKLKNAHDFALIAKAVRAVNSEFIFLYAGQGGECEAEIRALAGNDVQFLGYRKDTQDLLNACDIYLSTTLSEGLSLSALEAAQLGKPIFTYDAEGMAEVVANGENGIIFKIKDTENIAREILNFNKENFKNIFDAEEFSVLSTVRNQKLLYKNLLKKN